MGRFARISMRIVGGAVALVLLLWLSAAAYININKEKVLKQITAQLNANLNGTLGIGSMEPTLVRGFPGVAIELHNVLLRDSMWHVHKHDLLQAKNVFVSVNAFSILRGSPRIREVKISDGKVYLFTDSLGYSNTSLFKKKSDTTKKGGSASITRFTLRNVDFVMENKTKAKLFHFDIDKLAGKIDYTDDGWKAKTDIRARVKDFMFNTAKGSFLKNKMISTDLKVTYNTKEGSLDVPVQKIDIDEDELEVGGSFMLKQQPATFTLTIKADDIYYKDAVSLVAPNISKKLKMVDFKKDISLDARIQGTMKYRDTPLVNVAWTIKRNVLLAKGNTIEDCSFKGTYSNEAVKGAGHNDRNSVIRLFSMKGSYSDIPFTADTIQVTNLVDPVLQGRFASKFALTKLNPLLGGNIFHFNEGEANVDLHYRGSISNNDAVTPYIIGYVKVEKANMTYVPRDLVLKDCRATLNFTGNDVNVVNTRVQSGTSILSMNGSLKNFLNLYYTDPQKIVLDWNISSTLINLNEFKSFLGKRKKVITVATAESTANSGNKIRAASQQLDRVLDESSAHMTLHVDKLIYNKFEANGINAEVTLAKAGISLHNVSLNTAGGKLAVSGHVDQSGPVNFLTVKADITNVNVQRFFTSFENFGQDAITDKNLRGNLYALANVKGSITDKGTIVDGSMAGAVDFNLKNGALVNFEPFEKVSKFAFRKRNLSNITFADLKNKIELKDNLVTINPMLIESSAINMHVEGTYGMLNKGTDINIDVPLRNPKKDELITDDTLKAERQMKGIVLHLKAIDGEDGKVKIKWAKKDKDGSDTPAVDEELAPKKTKKRRDRSAKA